MVWDADNDGASSGLDADMVDGYHASNLPYVPAAGSWAGDLTSNGYTRHTGVNTNGGEFALLEKNNQMSTLVDGDYFAYEAGGFGPQPTVHTAMQVESKLPPLTR